MDKPLIQYPNGNSLKYPYHVQFQQQFYTSSHNVFHRPQSQRTNHQRYTEIVLFLIDLILLHNLDLSMMIIEMLKNKKKRCLRGDVTI
jgi:hypothetical protein